MAELSDEEVSEVGLNPTFNAAAAGGDTFVNRTGSRTILYVKNGDASPHTVTVTADRVNFDTPGGGRLRKANVAVQVPAGEERAIGPFPQGAFGERPSVTYDAVTNLTVAVMRL